MNTPLLIAVITLSIINILILLIRRPRVDVKSQLQDLEASMIKIETQLQVLERSLGDQFQRGRAESGEAARLNRQELTRSLESFSVKFSANVQELGKATTDSVKDVRETIEKQHTAIR